MKHCLLLKYLKFYEEKKKQPYEGSIIISILQIRKAKLEYLRIDDKWHPGAGTWVQFRLTLTSVLIIMLCTYGPGP